MPGEVVAATLEGVVRGVTDVVGGAAVGNVTQADATIPSASTATCGDLFNG